MDFDEGDLVLYTFRCHNSAHAGASRVCSQIGIVKKKAMMSNTYHIFILEDNLILPYVSSKKLKKYN